MSTASAELPPLGKTGAWTSACRAYESSKPSNERMFYDPYARIFAGSQGMGYLRDFCNASKMNMEDATRGIRARTQFLDQQLVDCVATLHDESDNKNALPIQVVMVGCGGDTRAFRLLFPESSTLKIFEIDLPEVVEYREKIFPQNDIYPPSNVTIHRIGTDLRYKSWTDQLMEAGYDRNRKSIWMLEGILKYFEHGSTLDHIMEWMGSIMEYDSYVIGDVVNNKHIQMTAKPWKESFGGGKMVSGIDVPDVFFERFGFGDIYWKQVGIPSQDKEMMMQSKPYQGDHLRRWFVFVTKWKGNSRSHLVSKL